MIGESDTLSDSRPSVWGKWLELVLDLIPTGLIFVELETARIKFFNRAVSEKAGMYPRAPEEYSDAEYYFTDLEGRNIPQSERPRFRVARGETFRNLQLVWHSPLGSWVVLAASAIIPGMGECPAIGLITFHDISRLKEVEWQLKQAKQRAEDANLAKTNFVANVSHEIRTPLGAVLGFTELMKDPALSTKERLEYAEIIGRNGLQLSNLINDVLDMSKIEAGKFAVNEVPVSLVELIGEVEKVMRINAARKGIELVVLPLSQLPEAVLTDPMRVRQILMNLIGNAIKFTSRGKVTLSVEVRGLVGEVLQIAIRIADTGIGVPRDQQQRIFEPFVQADSSTTRQFGGTGLGLILSQRLARSMGGDLYLVESESGRGTVFEVLLCVRECVPKIESKPSYHAAGKRLKNVRILLADDSDDNRLLIKKFLLAEGAIVDPVKNGREAVHRALKVPYDVILMDIQMPIMDGYSATRQLRSHGYQGPIIALTAHALKEERERAFNAGCNNHLTKPVSRMSLVATVEAYVNCATVMS